MITTIIRKRAHRFGANKTNGFCYIACSLCLFISQNCSAIYVENLSIEHGLSQSTVYDIKQDNAGYLWIGTNDGLNRYDGVDFIVFGSNEEKPDSSTALSNHNIYHMTRDPKGNFWISTH